MAEKLKRFFGKKVAQTKRVLRRAREIWYRWYTRDQRRKRGLWHGDEIDQFHGVNTINWNVKVSRMNPTIDQCSLPDEHSLEPKYSINNYVERIDKKHNRVKKKSQLLNPKQ